MSASSLSRRASFALASAILVGGCIPYADPPRGYAESAQRDADPPRPVYSPPAPSQLEDDSYQRRSVDAEDAASDGEPAAAPRAAQRSDRRQPLRLDARALGAQPGPAAWDATPVTADAETVPSDSYIVRTGDTLRGIGNKTGAGSEAIARANAIPAPFIVHPGQKLVIPGGRYHLVRPGQTGIGIARAYGVSWDKIIAANGLEEPFVLRNGQRLLIPETGPLTREQRAAAFKLDIDDILTGGEPALADRARPTEGSRSPTRILPPDAVVAAPRELVGGFAWPLRGGRVIKSFGPGRGGVREDGIEIAAPLGTPVLASADGVVAYVGSDIQALGGIVILKHGDGWTSIYGHTDQLMVRRGQSVRRGQTIALSGDTGGIQPSLHFELRKGRTPVNPIDRLPNADR